MSRKLYHFRDKKIEILAGIVVQLYIAGCSKEQFYNVLESNLKPIYEAARMQGYGVWKNN